MMIEDMSINNVGMNTKTSLNAILRNGDFHVSNEKNTKWKRSHSVIVTDSESSNFLHHSIPSTVSSDPWGWFDDFDSNNPTYINYDVDHNQRSKISQTISSEPILKINKALSLPLPAYNPPLYVLESSVQTQQLWYETAGQRLPQPEHERKYFESLWQRNFELSSVKYQEIIEKDYNLDENMRVDADGGTIIFRGSGPFSTSVSKSFPSHNISCLTLQMPSYRVIRSKSGNDYAEFLVVATFSNIQSLSFGIWKRYSHFLKLFDKIQSHNPQYFRNSKLSWKCILNRKRWYKCLERDYLELKCFLLERFLHDALFESPNPELISTFLGLG